MDDFLRSPKEGIEHLFMSNGSFRTMTRIDGVGRWKRKEFFLDTAEQLGRISSWKIRPSNSLTKEGITG